MPFVIPCKPTSPRVKVELLNQDGEVIDFLTYKDFSGFNISERNLTGEGFLRCNGSFNMIVQEINIIYRNVSGMSIKNN